MERAVVPALEESGASLAPTEPACSLRQPGCPAAPQRSSALSTCPRLPGPPLSSSVRFPFRQMLVSAFIIIGVATCPLVAVGESSSVRRAATEEGFAKDSHWARLLQQKWSEPSYLEMVARTIAALENEDFWMAFLGKQLQLQGSKAQLKALRLERHRLEQRRKKHAVAAYYATAGEKPGADIDLRFGDVSLYALDWIAPRTCADLSWAGSNDVCALSLETDIHVMHAKLMLKSVEVQDFQNRLFSTGGPDVPASEAAMGPQTPLPADSVNANVPASLRPKETFDWSSVARDIYLPSLAELQAPGATPELFGVEVSQLMAALDREERIRSGSASAGGARSGALGGGASTNLGNSGRLAGSWTSPTTAGGFGLGGFH